ncbi:efflux RND transporter periplasmic adaptor subunit [Photobacterium aphoticum]|uniref:Hemolysin D n=1 Tax=Photobacterium aphoticum TaxID=754436 RepID=A0A0J1GG98_9GAMM|nr:efflux RND transporter periplasmic adaptor subunit [Photobacterium aphoticum]KLU98717.1 hemolysin D [Photobacterium aphoticum]PSU55193.1 efflux RND transporter periplasmic adaptor subunit [Photobacterium aphoticum]
MRQMTINNPFSRKPWILSVIILVVIAAWLLSGLGTTPSDEASQSPSTDNQNNRTQTASTTEIPLATVKVSQFQTQAVARTLSLYGRTAPNRQATLAAEVSGTIEKLLVKKGHNVKAGQALVQLSKADRELQLKRAQALLKVRNQEYKAAQSLRKRGLQGEVALSQTEAALVEAKAALRSAQIDLENTVIYAPFDGILESLHIEKGDYVGIGDPVANIVDLDPLVISADVSERHVNHVFKGQKAAVQLVSDHQTEGTLRYRASVASANTNTYPIEVEISNPDMRFTAGTSANLELLLETKDAIKMTPSMLALDEAGNLGIKTIVDNDKVKFIPIAVVKVEPDGVWLGDTPNPVEVITVGQGFVRDGDTVIPAREQDKADSDNEDSQ